MSRTDSTKSLALRFADQRRLLGIDVFAPLRALVEQWRLEAISLRVSSAECQNDYEDVEASVTARHTRELHAIIEQLDGTRKA